MACAAIAIASSERARNVHTWKTIWCAATATVPTRAAIAAAAVRAVRSAAVRTMIWLPTRAVARMPAASGRRGASNGCTVRSTMIRYAVAAPYCAITVPHADPAIPGAQPVDQCELDAEVHGVRRDRDRDHERRRRVLPAPLVSGPGQRDQHRRRPDEADPEVGQRERPDCVRRAHHVDDQRREHDADHGEGHAQPGCEPQAVDPDRRRPALVTGADEAGRPPRSWSTRGSCRARTPP